MKELLAVGPKKASGKKRSRKKKTRTTIATLVVLHINTKMIVIVLFLNFLKLAGNLLVMSNDITNLLKFT